MASNTTLIFLIGIPAVLAVIIMFVIFARRYKLVPPDRAMVVYGSSGRGSKRGYQVISGGARLILPVLQDYAWLPLDVRTLDVRVIDVVTDVERSGVKISVLAVAQIKIASDPASLYTAAEHLLHKSDAQINEIALKTMEGHVRGVCATMTVEQINSDRDTISGHIQSMAVKDLMNMGITIRSFVVKEIEDQEGYLDALGVKRTEEVKRDARIGRANANREATIQEANAAREGEQANAEAEGQVAIYHRDRDITIQKSQSEVEKERANREIAFEIQHAKRQQELIVEQRNIDIRDKEKRIELEQAEVKRAEQEQIAQLVVPAKAHAQSVAAEAEGQKSEAVIRAEGTRQSTILVAEGEKMRLKEIAEGERVRLEQEAVGKAAQIRETGGAEAEVIRLKGEATAEAIRLKGLAEAEAMEKKAEAWRKYGDAAIAEMIVSALPAIAREVSLPLQNTEKIIIMGREGHAGLIDRSVDVMATLPTLVKELTGKDISEIVDRVAGRSPPPPKAGDPKGK